VRLAACDNSNPDSLCHPEHEGGYIVLFHRVTGLAVHAAVVLLGNKLSMPGQQRYWRDQSNDFCQKFTAYLLAASGKTPTLVIGEPKTPFSELLAVLLAQVVDDLSLSLVHPSGYSNHDEVKRIQASVHGLVIVPSSSPAILPLL